MWSVVGGRICLSRVPAEWLLGKAEGDQSGLCGAVVGAEGISETEDCSCTDGGGSIGADGAEDGEVDPAPAVQKDHSRALWLVCSRLKSWRSTVLNGTLGMFGTAVTHEGQGAVYYSASLF